MNRHFRNSTSLSAAVLCVMASFAAVGCADAEDQAPAEGTQQAAITSRGIAVNGCAGTALFNIMNNAANLNSAINSIAIDQSAISNVTSQLWSVNSQNELVQVHQQSQQVSQEMATALSNFTNNTNAYQRATAWQSANATQYAAANTTTTASHFDSADTWSNSTSAVYNEASGSSYRNTNAFNRAWGNQVASNVANTSQMSSNFVDSIASQSSFASNAAFISNDLLGGFAAFGLAGFNAAGISNTVAFNNAFATQRAASANTAFANTSVADLARSGFLTSANTSAAEAANFFNSSRAVNQQANRTSVANAATTTSTQSVADLANTSTNAMQDSMAAQNAYSQQYNAANSSNMLANAQSFTNLTQLNSQNYVLQLNFTANAEQAFTSLFALNQNNNILASNNFNFSFPGCGAGIVGPIGGPVLLPPDAEGAAEAVTADIEIGPALVREERE